MLDRERVEQCTPPLAGLDQALHEPSMAGEVRQGMEQGGYRQVPQRNSRRVQGRNVLENERGTPLELFSSTKLSTCMSMNGGQLVMVGVEQPQSRDASGWISASRCAVPRNPLRS